MGNPLPDGRYWRLARRQGSSDLPISVAHVDSQAKCLDVSLTKAQAKNSPDVDTHQPVTRQHETAYLGYYGYANYWAGGYVWGPASYPSGLANPAPASREPIAYRVQRESMLSYLRSAQAVTGYAIEAADGEIGHVDGFCRGRQRLGDPLYRSGNAELLARQMRPGISHVDRTGELDRF